jgi:signal transduction histidine kinase
MTHDTPQPSTGSPQRDAGTEKLLEIGRLAGNVAHKANNHLTSILTFAHLMREKANMDAQDREDLDLIIRESTQAAALMKNLQDFSREPPQ